MLQQKQTDYSLPPIPDPLTELLKRLDHDMDNILHRGGVPLSEKLTQYNEVLSDYLNKTKQYRSMQQRPPLAQNTPPTVPLQNPPLALNDGRAGEAVNVPDHGAVGSGGIDDYTTLISGRYQPKAKRLISFVSRVPGVGWTDRGELKLGGKVYHNSHIVDLISHAVKPPNRLQRGVSAPLSGWSAFAEALKGANIPHDLVSESMRKEWLKNPSTPPTSSVSGEEEEEEEEEEGDFGVRRLFHETEWEKAASTKLKKINRRQLPRRSGQSKRLRWQKI